MNDETKQKYFAGMARTYPVHTGNTTKEIFAKFMNGHKGDLTSESVVHDNAAGPGTATQVLIERAAKTGVAPTIVATDYVPAMIEELERLKAEGSASNPAWNNVTAKVANSADLSMFDDEYFTHSINNFSLFTITDAVPALRETYRTLKTGGVAAVLLWRRYAIEPLLLATQDIVRGEGYSAKNAIPVNGPQYFKEGVVPSQLAEAGFDEDKMVKFQIDHIVTEEEKWKWDGLVKFLNDSPAVKKMIADWTDEEKAKWPGAVEQALAEEKAQFGGIKFETWVTIAMK